MQLFLFQFSPNLLRIAGENRIHITLLPVGWRYYLLGGGLDTVN